MITSILQMRKLSHGGRLELCPILSPPLPAGPLPGCVRERCGVNNRLGGGAVMESFHLGYNLAGA